MSDPAELDVPEAEVQSFEEEKTSPEFRLRVPARHDDSARPIVVVAYQDNRRRGRIIELLRGDGWNALEAHDAEELIEMAVSLAPHVILVDADLRTGVEISLPEQIRQHRPDAAMRMVALLGNESPAERIARALADGYDDFVVDVDNDLKLLTRATANLRAARTLAQLNKQKRDAALLLELTQALGSSLDMQLILHTVSRLIAEVITLERCSIILLDPDDDDAIMVAASEDRAVRDLRIRLSNYPEVKRCVESAAPVLIEDVTRDPLLSNVSQRLIERGVRTMALFPIVFEEQVTGVLFLRSSQPARVLTEHEIQFGQTVAASCAVAIRNARLFDHFRDEHQQMQSMKQQAERQTEALRKYQDFFEYAADGISVIDVDGRIHYVNKEGRRLLGRTRDELKALNFQELLVDDSKRRWSEVVDQVRHGRFQRSFDVFVVVAEEERIFSLSAGGVGAGTGLLILSFRDVTEMREMEGELRTTKEFLENLIDSSVDAIVAADMNGNIMLFNKGAERMYGYRGEDVIGRMHVSQLYPNNGANEVMQRLREERWGGRGRLAPERREILTAAGDVVPVSMSASVIYEDGEEVATVGMFTDLRDRITIERQLNEARDQLTKAERARVAAELAGMAAHELNQPLTSVLGYAEMLKARVPESDTRLRRPIETIFVQAERMAEIVRKIGRVTKYETKRYGGKTDMIDLDRAIEQHRSGVDHMDIPTITTPQGFMGLGNRGLDEEHTDPRRQRPVFPEAGSPTTAAAISLSSSNVPAVPRPMPAVSNDARSSIVRMDTVDDEPGYARRLRTPTQGLPRADEAVTAPPGPARPLPRSLSIDNVGGGDENDDHTNPGVRMSDLRRRHRTDDEG